VSAVPVEVDALAPFREQECDRCSNAWTHRPDHTSAKALSGHNYPCDEHYEDALSFGGQKPGSIATITFTKNADGKFSQEGEIGTDVGRFQWLTGSGKWDGGWAIEPVADLLARMNLGGPYKYSAYRILEAEKPELVMKPTCYGCGTIAGISCGFNPLGVGRDFSRCNGDSLIDFNEDHQFSVSFPVKTEGKNFGKHKLKIVWFNSVRCANLALLELTRKQTGKKYDEVVHYDYAGQTLGEYRAAQGYKRCPTCRRINKQATPFCDDVCKNKYQGDINVVLETAAVTAAVTKPQQATVELRGRCANQTCGQGRDEKGNRVRARVLERGDICSKDCRVKIREAKKQAIRQAERQSEAVEAVA
jgi:hypothetical protein